MKGSSEISHKQEQKKGACSKKSIFRKRAKKGFGRGTILYRSTPLWTSFESVTEVEG